MVEIPAHASLTKASVEKADGSVTDIPVVRVPLRAIIDDDGRHQPDPGCTPDVVATLLAQGNETE